MSQLVDKSYNLGLVVLSVLVATIGSYVAIEVAQRLRARREGRRFLWIAGGALAMGFAIWSMHFVGMLALHLPMPVWYDGGLIGLSIVAAAAGSAVAFFIFSRETARGWLIGLASVFMGFAIAGMHYTGMAGMRTGGAILYDPLVVGASVAVAIIVSFAALWLTRSLASASESASLLTFKKIAASILMGFAIAGMHYTGMAAAHFHPAVGGWRPTGILVLGTSELGFMVAVSSVSLLIVALAGTHFERINVANKTRFEDLLELSPQIVWFGDADGSISYSNPYWYEYTGRSKRQTLGDAWTGAIHPDDRDRAIDAWRDAVEHGTDYEVELRLCGADDNYRWFLARARPGRDDGGKVDAWMGIAVDIEQRRRAEEEARAASTAKSEFLASMSHELRTPLNAIGGYADLLAMGVRGPLSPLQAQDIARIRRSQQHLLTLINDILNFAKVDAGQIEYHVTAVPVDDALRDTEAMIAPQVLAKRLQYTYRKVDHTTAVAADPEKFRQIVLNLLSNAVKFTEEGGAITLGARDHGDCIDIVVQDTGPGIAPEKLETIFDPFVQVDRSLNQPVQGVGLGLAISQDLARGMNGEITVHSKIGKGSTFILSLPRATTVEFDPPKLTPGIADRTPAPELADRALHERPHPESPKKHRDENEREYNHP